MGWHNLALGFGCPTSRYCPKGAGSPRSLNQTRRTGRSLGTICASGLHARHDSECRRCLSSCWRSRLTIRWKREPRCHECGSHAWPCRRSGRPRCRYCKGSWGRTHWCSGWWRPRLPSWVNAGRSWSLLPSLEWLSRWKGGGDQRGSGSCHVPCLLPDRCGSRSRNRRRPLLETESVHGYDSVERGMDRRKRSLVASIASKPLGAPADRCAANRCRGLERGHFLEVLGWSIEIVGKFRVVRLVLAMWPRHRQ